MMEMMQSQPKKLIYSPDTMPPVTGEHEFHHQCLLLLLFLLLQLRQMVAAMAMKEQGAIMTLHMKMKAVMMMTIASSMDLRVSEC